MTPDALKALLTPDVLRQLTETLSTLMTLGNDFGRCNCNGCNHTREQARDVLCAALAPLEERQETTLYNIAMCARRGYAHGHPRGTPVSCEDQVKFRDRMLGDIIAFCNAAGVTSSVLRTESAQARVPPGEPTPPTCEKCGAFLRPSDLIGWLRCPDCGEDVEPPPAPPAAETAPQVTPNKVKGYRPIGVAVRGRVRPDFYASVDEPETGRTLETFTEEGFAMRWTSAYRRGSSGFFGHFGADCTSETAPLFKSEAEARDALEEYDTSVSEAVKLTRTVTVQVHEPAAEAEKP